MTLPERFGRTRPATVVLTVCVALAGCGGGGGAQHAAATTTAAPTTGSVGPADHKLCGSINRLAQPTTQAASEVPPSPMVIGYLAQLRAEMDTAGLVVSPKLAAAAGAVDAAVTKLELQVTSGVRLSSDDLMTAMADMVSLCSSEGLANVVE